MKQACSILLFQGCPGERQLHSRFTVVIHPLLASHANAQNLADRWHPDNAFRGAHTGALAHPRQSSYAAARISSRSQISASAATSSCIIASLWAGPGVKRRRSVPRGTVGKLIGCT